MAGNEELVRKCSALERHLSRRSEFERIIIAVSARLSRHETEPIDEVITQSLGELESITGCCRIFLFLYEKASSDLIHLYEWKKEGRQTQLQLFRSIAELHDGWLASKLKDGESINFPDSLNNDNTPIAVKEIIQKMEITKLLVFPIFINYDVEGFLAFDGASSIADWSDDDFQFFRAILQFLGMALDRVITEEKLRKSEEKYRSVLESIKEAYFEINEQAIFSFFNYALCDMSAYSSNEILGKPFTFFLIDSDRVKFGQFFAVLKNKPAPKRNIEVELKRKDGKRIYVEGTFYVKQSPQGGANGFYGFLRDITERKKSEDLREKFTQKLEIEVKMRTKELNDTLAQQKLYLDQILKASQFKSEFMATMSHELRTPLNAIIGFSELLLAKLYGDLNKEQTEYLENIHASADHLLEMINHILDISKIEAGKLQLNIELVSLNELVKQVEIATRPSYKKKDLQFIIEGMDTERLVYADPIRVKEILMNLISNAIKYTSSGSITVSCVEKSNEIAISVKDTGIGIPEKDHGRVFKEFERIENSLSQSTQGTGLGLSLTRRLVHLHGGEITFKSIEGKGSTFTFTLPKQYGLRQG
ncbi:MAG: ATP-binding protein [Candidatus Sigynarchaeota archaeon]